MSKYTREMHQAVIHALDEALQQRAKHFDARLFKADNKDILAAMALTYDEIVPPQQDDWDASYANEQLARWVAEQAIALVVAHTDSEGCCQVSDTVAVKWAGEVLATAREAVRAEKAWEEGDE